MDTPVDIWGAARVLRLTGHAESRVELEGLLRHHLHEFPDDAGRLMDLATTVDADGDRQGSRAFQEEAMRYKTHFRVPAKQGPALRLLAVVAPGDMETNTPLALLLEDSDVQLELLYVSAQHPLPTQLPDHDVLFNAMDAYSHTLPLLHHLAEHPQAKGILNDPAKVCQLVRERAWQQLAGVEGLVVPSTTRVARTELLELVGGQLALAELLVDGAFPLIIRPVDAQRGRGLARLADLGELASYLAAEADDTFTVAPYCDYQSIDGQYRKVRLAFIDGQCYAVHLAISPHWIVHFQSAGMDLSSEKRAEEARFFAGFETDFAHRHALALAGLVDRIGLDYMVLDVGETPDGRLVVFEVHTAAIVHAMDSPDLYPYKVGQMQKVFNAFRAMLDRKSSS